MAPRESKAAGARCSLEVPRADNAKPSHLREPPSTSFSGFWKSRALLEQSSWRAFGDEQRTWVLDEEKKACSSPSSATLETAVFPNTRDSCIPFTGESSASHRECGNRRYRDGVVEERVGYEKLALSNSPLTLSQHTVNQFRT